MKRIDNNKSFRVCTFIFGLALLLLLSSTIGKIVAIKPEKPPGKPDNPGSNPPPPPTLYWFYISIGDEGDDVVLESPPTLEVVSTVDSCGWNWPPEKGTKSGGWTADPSAPWHPYPPDRGSYVINLTPSPGQPLPDLPDLIDADYYTIHHQWSSRPIKINDYDRQPINFWELNMHWGRTYSNPPDYTGLRYLRIWTDWGPEIEGDYYPKEGEVEVWTVDFNGASWELYGHYADGTGYLLTEGTIVNGFDVTIVKGEIVT